MLCANGYKPLTTYDVIWSTLRLSRSYSSEPRRTRAGHTVVPIHQTLKSVVDDLEALLARIGVIYIQNVLRHP